MAEIGALFDALTDAINVQDVYRVVHCFSPGAVFVTPGGVTEGHEQIGWYFRQLFTAFPDMRNEITAWTVLDDTIIAEWTFSGTHTGALLLPGGAEIAGSGRRIVLPAAGAYTMEDGVFASGRVYYDQLALYRQTGCDLRLRRTA
ncbi:nuclear transport factor 2 family protein [Microbispora sp. NEAU-D428]|uniref:ester cyclase n=1 Tax=Microbispora sitophila TaxID=2771537 RepID=UPI001867D6F3|nr:nuclear transport factor 2 family protein [Microbispora sitophila]MBE3014613.1 nuclear transport factor 2 family protein [Microbispora sitophila]